MSGLGDVWRRMTGAARPLAHCGIHADYTPECAACREANAPAAYVPQPDFSAPADSLLFTEISSGSSDSGSVDVGDTPAVDASSMDTSSGFDGFDGGSSDGGGASGDW